MKKIFSILLLAFIIFFPNNVKGDDGFVVTFDSGNNGVFLNGETTKQIRYSNPSGYKLSYMANLNEYGEKQSVYQNYAGDSYIRGTDRSTGVSSPHVLSFPGAQSLIVDIFYNTNSTSDIYIYKGTSKISSNRIGAFGGSSNNTVVFRGHKLGKVNHDVLEVEGDSVLFSINFGYSNYGERYGYYAFVRPKKITSDSYEEPIGKNGKVFVGWDEELDLVTESRTLHAVYKDGFDVTFKSTANGKFSDNSDTKVLKLIREHPVKTAVAHSANIDDSGHRNGIFKAVTNSTKNISIPGASSLRVSLTYHIGDERNDVLSAKNSAGNSVFSFNTYSSQPDKKQTKTAEYLVDGNTINFTWTNTKDIQEYGWYAYIEAFDENGLPLYDESKFVSVPLNQDEYEEPIATQAKKRFSKWNPDISTLTASRNVNAVYEDAIVESGTFGCKWSLYEDGELQIGTSGGTCTLTSTTYTDDVPWYYRGSEIKKVTFLGNVKTNSKQNYLFSGCNNLIEADLTSLNTSNSTDLSSLFAGCTNLQTVKFGNVTNIQISSYMFEDCINLHNISWGSGWQKVTTMIHMFENSGIETIDFRGMNLSNVETAYGIFMDCPNLKQVYLGNFGANGKITSLNDFLSGDSSMEYLDLSSFNGNNLTSINRMFKDATSLKKVTVNTNIFKPKITSCDYAFSNCDSLDLSFINNFDASGCKSMKYTFGFIDQDSIDLSKWKTNSLEDASYMFYHSGFKYIDATQINSDKIKNVTSMFAYMDNLEKVDLTDFCRNTVLTNVSGMFDLSPKIEVLDLSSLNLSHASPSDFGILFKNQALKAVYLSAYMVPDSSFTHGFEIPDNGRWKHVYSPTEMSFNNSKVTYTSDQIYDMDRSELEGLWVLDGTNVEDTGFISKKRQYADVDGWDKVNNDTWIYTLYVEDDTIPYYLSEGYMPGFVSDIPSDTGYKIITNGVGEVTNTSLTKTGSLTISKSVQSHTTDRSFKFIITLTGDRIQDGDYRYGDIIFTNGVGEVFLKDGESITIEGIPAGVSYDVEELESAPYIPTSSNNTGIINESGNLVTFVNTYADAHEGSEKVDIKLSKKTLGLFIDDTYTIYAELEGLSMNHEYTVTSNGTHPTSFTSDINGKAFVTLSISPDETLILKDIPNDTKFRFSEKAGNYYSSYTVVDKADKYTINSPSGQNTEKNKSLSTAFERVVVGSDVNVVFTNRFQDFENLKISKVVTDEEESETRFEFTVVFNELPANASFESDIGRIIADDEGRAEKTFLLADGESVEFTNVPVGTRYYFKESPSVYKASFNIEELKGAGGSITKASAANTTNKKELQTAIEVIEKGEYNHVIFTNSPPQTKSFTLKKELLEGDANKDFEFTIYLKDVNNPIGGNFDYTGSKSGSLFFNEAGYASISLKKDQYIVINGLPQGATVAVKENDYVGDGYAVAEVNAVVNGTTTSVNVENNEGRYSVVLDNDTYMTVKNGPANMPSDAVLTIKKNVSGNLGNRYKDFEFDISATGIDNFAFTKNGAALTPTITSGKTTITLKHDDVLTITAPVGTQITIEEHDYTADGYSTYIGNSLTASRSTTVTLEEDSEVIFNNSSSSIVSTNVAALQNLVMIITLCSLFIILLILVLLFSRKYKEKRG